MNDNKGLGLFKLTCFAIGTTLASGVFSMFSDMAAKGAGTFAVLIGWAIAGIGMYSLAMCFNRLSVIRPDLKSGIFSYAREGFGEYIGFNAAWGYWISAILSQVSFATLLFAALGHLIPAFGDGNNLLSMVCASILIWGFLLFILRGVQEAVTVNAIIVIAKIIPIIAFILVILLMGAFNLDIFLNNFKGEDTGLSLGKQIFQTTYTTVWIFTGIEGAIVISGRGKTTAIAGRATEISFLVLLVLYVMISILSMGIMPREQLASLKNPAMATLLATVVGPWGATLINLGVVISIAGAMFSYTILTADCAFAPSALGCFPRFLSVENKKKSPVTALLTTGAIVQILLIIVFFQSSTYQAMYTLATSAIMIPFFLSALYCLKLTFGHSQISSTASSPSPKIWIISILGVVYGAWMIISTGIENILVSALLYGPGFFFYLWSKIENRRKFFETGTDIITAMVIAVGFVLSMILLLTGRFTLF